jgi:hypothetical protein
MLPLISSLTTEFAGLPGDSTAGLPVADEAGSHFAGMLRQSVAHGQLAEHGPPAGNALPLDGRSLPPGLEGVALPTVEIELPMADFSGHGPITTGSLESRSILEGLGLVPKPIAEAIASELGEPSSIQPTEIDWAIGELANLERSRPDAHRPEPIDDLLDPAATSVTPPLALIAEQRLCERNAAIGIVRGAGRAPVKPTDIGLAAGNPLTRAFAAEQVSAAPAAVTALLNLAAASIPDGATAAIQAGKVASETIGGATTPLTGGSIDASAALNNGSLPGHASPTSTAPLNPTAGVTTGAATMHIGTPLQHAAWSNELGSRVVLMSGQQLQSARIQLSPAELGPITVNLVVDDGSADLTFHAHHVLTRDAIEQALPRLREMLNDNGLTLGNATVSDQGVQKDGSGRASREARGVESPGDATTGREESSEAQPARVSRGLLDTFV